MALIKDAGEKIAYFCNHFEGDGFLAPYAYDGWHDLNDHMTEVVERYVDMDYPSSVRDVAINIAPHNEDLQITLIQRTVDKAKIVKDKLESDTLTRLTDTLKILRGSRLLGFQYIRNNNIEALKEETLYVQWIPMATPLMARLLAELPTYKKLADGYDSDDVDGWVFWRRYYTSLPVWYKVASEVALVMCSSASVERVFSLLNCLFDDHQHRALNDYKEGSVRIRYNENYRDRKQYE